MPSVLQKKILLLLIFFGHYTLIAQVKFSATVSSPQISKNEMLQLRLIVENANEVEQITAPDFKNFVLVSGPNQESGMAAVNGNISQYVALNYILKPKFAGNFKFTAATAKADGKEYKSNSITVQVTNTTTPANNNSNFNSPFTGYNPFDDIPRQTEINDYILKKGEHAADKINNNMFVKVQTDKNSCFVGEPVLATYRLYTRLKSESNVVKNPSFNGFSVIDLQPGDFNYSREKINGKEYNVYIIRRAQLYPLQPGNLVLEPIEIENEVTFIKEAYANRENNLNNGLLNDLTETTLPAEAIEKSKAILQNKPYTIFVKPLPEINIPSSFKGAVGNFSITAGLEKNNFTTDDAGKLNIIINGEGNLQLVNLPEVKWPLGIDAFEPTATDDLFKNTVPVSGRKILSFNFTAAQPGNYILPPVIFSYFNPLKGKYITDSTKPITFSVTQGIDKKIKPVIIKAEEKSLVNKFFNNRRWVVSAISILILCGLIFWLRRDKKKEESIKTYKKEEEARIAEIQNVSALHLEQEKNRLQKASEMIHGESNTFYHELDYAVKSYLSEKLQLPLESINKKWIAEELDKKNIAVNTSMQLQQIMNEIELQLYAPFAENDNRQDLYNRTAAIIQLLDACKI
jgi:hypothetical protein